jgi:hypothetical protein
MKKKIKYLKKGESTFLHIGQVLLQVWQDRRDVKLISTLHTVEIVESGKRNGNGEQMKPEIIHNIQGMGRADQMLHYYPCRR